MSETVECDYCGSDELAYELHSDKGPVVRCIPCLAIEQGQQKVSLPFDAWLDRDEIEPVDHEDAPDFDAFDPRRHDYETVRAWFTVLARIKDDEPLLKRDPEQPGAIFEDTREFLTNIMGSAAFYAPSEIAEAGGDPAQATLGEAGDSA